jgi:hypothetical protein
MNPLYCKGPAHDHEYPAPILGHADHPEHVHVLCNICARAAREAQAKDGNKLPLHQYAKISAPQAKARLEAGEKPDSSPPLSELPPPPPPPKIGPLARLQS